MVPSISPELLSLSLFEGPPFEGVLGLLLAIIMVLVSVVAVTGLGIALMQPWISSVIRARASYAPPALALPDERDEPVSYMDQPTILGMMHRAVRLRGWRALYAGGALQLIDNTWGSVVSLILGVVIATQPQYTTHVALLTLLAAPALVVPGLLLRVLVVRAIVHRASPRTTWKDLLPVGTAWHIYVLPGVWPAYLLSLVLSTQLLPLIFFLALGPSHRVTAGGILVLVLLLLALVAIVVPLEVAFVRLAAQELDLAQSQSQSQHNTDPAAENEQDGETELVVNPRSVLALPTLEGGPSRPTAYTGLVNCLRTLVKEEGYGALYRGAAFTFVVLWSQALTFYGNLQ